MKLHILYFAFVMATFGLFITSCDNTEEPEVNRISVSIASPLNAASISACADLHVHVDVIATVENHTFEVRLSPDDNSEKRLIDFSVHDHDRELIYVEDIDLCAYPSGTCFTLEATACVDHLCENIESAQAQFCLD